jgi:hypothetical protein
MMRNFCRATISERDFEEAEGYLVEYPDSTSTMARKAFLVAAIIAYGRPFTNNEQSSDSKASAKVSLINGHLLTDQEKRMHESLMKLRKAMSQLVVETVLFFQEMPGNKALA